jgi:RNA polymerase sigma-70 factor (ECF subfamily)
VNSAQPAGDGLPVSDPPSSRASAAGADSSRAAPDPLRATVARMALGDEAALAALYETTSAFVYGLALRILRDRPSCEEIVVEVYAQAWKQARRYDATKGSVLTWLGMMARTRSIDLARARARFLAHESALDLDLETAEVGLPGPLERTALHEHAARVRGALQSLPREQRSLIEAAFFGGLSHTEIAAAAGQPLGTVKTRIRLGLLALRRALAPLEEELA